MAEQGMPPSTENSAGQRYLRVEVVLDRSKLIDAVVENAFAPTEGHTATEKNDGMCADPPWSSFCKIQTVLLVDDSTQQKPPEDGH